MGIPHKEFSVTAYNSTIRAVCCENCHKEYAYVLKCVGRSTVWTALWNSTKDAEKKAEQQANESLQRQHRDGVDAVPDVFNRPHENMTLSRAGESILRSSARSVTISALRSVNDAARRAGSATEHGPRLFCGRRCAENYTCRSFPQEPAAPNAHISIVNRLVFDKLSAAAKPCARNTQPIARWQSPT